MRLRRSTIRTPIGLDIGGRHVKAAQLEKCHGASAWRLCAAACFPRAAIGTAIESLEVRQIAEVLYRRGFLGNGIVVPVPADKLISGVLEVPARTAAVPIEQIARIEMARTHKCAPDSFEMGLWELPATSRANRGGQVMAVACAHVNASGVLDIFENEGLDVTALDVRSCALARAAAPLIAGETGVCAILDLGWESAMLAMLLDGAIVYARSLADAGTKTLHESLHSRLGVDVEVTDYLLLEIGLSSVEVAPAADGPPLPPEAGTILAAYVESLVQELKISLSYVNHTYPESPFSRLLLAGTNANIPGLAAHLSRALALEARVITPAELVECQPRLLDLGSNAALTVAVGLAQFEGE